MSSRIHPLGPCLITLTVLLWAGSAAAQDVLPRSEAATINQIRPSIEIDITGEPSEDPVGGEDRPVDVFVPSSYDGETPRPLLILLHSFTISGVIAESAWALKPTAEERGVIYAVPEGLRDRNGNPYWNSTSACCDGYGSGVDDSGYLRRVIEDIQARWNVDEQRIFTIGLSNGGFMGHRMACDHADLVAGIVSIAGTPDIDASLCAPSEGVHILNIHATEDQIILFDGGVFFDTYPSALETVERWLGHNGCGGQSEEPGLPIDADAEQAGSETSVIRYTDGCLPGGTVEFWEMVGSDHFFFPTSEVKSVLFDYISSHPKRVPEPGRGSLSAAALVVLAWLRRRLRTPVCHRDPLFPLLSGHHARPRVVNGPLNFLSAMGRSRNAPGAADPLDPCHALKPVWLRNCDS